MTMANCSRPRHQNAGEDESVGVTPDEGENTDEVIGDENIIVSLRNRPTRSNQQAGNT